MTLHNIHLRTLEINPNVDSVRDAIFGFIPSFVNSIVTRPFTNSVPIYEWVVTFEADVNPNPTPYLTAMLYPGINIIDLTIT